MDDFTSLEKNIIRELSCRLCLCTDVVKLKPLNAEAKRKIKKIFGFGIRTDDSLPKAICHDCIQQLTNMHLYTVKVEKTQKFLDFHSSKGNQDKKEMQPKEKPHPVNPITEKPVSPTTNSRDVQIDNKEKLPLGKTKRLEHGDVKETKVNAKTEAKNKSLYSTKFTEEMSLEEFLKSEKIDKSMLSNCSSIHGSENEVKKIKERKHDMANETLDPVVLIEGKPAKQGAALDRQITLFYKMECCICHENGFNFRSLMKHYKDRHGVPGYVTCCNKKFHYFHPKRIIEHMAYHLQPNIFMCQSCHQNFQTSLELHEHQTNGGHSEGKILCPRCSEKFPTYRELGCHIITHRTDKMQCDYCGKLLKHHHRKKTVNRMEDIILCSQCVRALKAIEKQEKDNEQKMKNSTSNSNSYSQRKSKQFKRAMGLSPDDDSSTD